MHSSSKKCFWSILGSDEGLGALRVGRERAEGRRACAEMLLQRGDAMRVVRVIRQELRHLSHVRVVEVLKQPHEPPRVVAARGADIRTSEIRCGLHLSRITQ